MGEFWRSPAGFLRLGRTWRPRGVGRTGPAPETPVVAVPLEGLLGPADPGVHCSLRRTVGMGDLAGAEPADRTQGERDLGDLAAQHVCGQGEGAVEAVSALVSAWSAR